MYALIGPDDNNINKKILEISSVQFEVAKPLFWVECNYECLSDCFYDEATGSIKELPLSPQQPISYKYKGIVNDEAEMVAYNFLANKKSVETYVSFEQFTQDKASGKLNTECHAQFFCHYYDIDKKEIIATCWIRDWVEEVKTVNKVVTEFYKYYAHKDFVSVAYDLNTDQPIEYYRYNYNVLTKYMWDTHVIPPSGYNIDITSFKQLPQELQDSLVDFKYKDDISCYSLKPYGRLVYVERYDIL